MITTFLVTILVAAFATNAAGQVRDEALAFEIASVKPHRGGLSPGMTGLAPPLQDGTTLLRFTATLQGIFVRAYDLFPGEISGPSWIQDKIYDVVARPPGVASRQEVAAMLRGLLAKRFHARVHWDEKEVAGYAITVGKNGPKLKPAEGAAGYAVGLRMGNPVTLRFPNTTLEELARYLKVDLAAPVVDRTGIQGRFDIEITCSPDSLPGIRSPAPAGPSVSTPAPSVFAAMRDFGLNLESRKVQAKTLVVESVDKVPTAN